MGTMGPLFSVQSPSLAWNNSFFPSLWSRRCLHPITIMDRALRYIGEITCYLSNASHFYTFLTYSVLFIFARLYAAVPPRCAARWRQLKKKVKREILWSTHTLSFSGPGMVSKKPLDSSIFSASFVFLLEIQRDKLWWSVGVGHHSETNTHRRTVNTLMNVK